MHDAPSVTFNCLCGKKYKYRSGLRRHHKTCNKEPPQNLTTIAPSSLIERLEKLELLMKENLERLNKMNQLGQLLNNIQTSNYQKHPILRCTQVTPDSTDIIVNPSEISTPYVQPISKTEFLNKCTDAVNITEFVQKIKYELSDLELLGQLGYVAGITRIFLNGWKTLEINKRPIWCSDEKREIIYLKIDGAWQKDDETLTHTKKVLFQIAKKFHAPLIEWRIKYPGYKNSEDSKSDEYQAMLHQALGGDNAHDDSVYNKIVRKIIHTISIKKSTVW